MDAAQLAREAEGLADLVRMRAKRLYRDADELRRLAARQVEIAGLLAETLEGHSTREDNDTL